MLVSHLENQWPSEIFLFVATVPLAEILALSRVVAGLKL